MKLRFFVLLSLVVLCGYGLAGAQSISVDHTDGLIDPTHMSTGVPITFYIRFTGDANSHGGVTNGFRVYSADGATWGSMVGDTLGPLGKAQFDGGFFISPFSVTGSGADTVGFGAFRFFGTGLPAGFDDVVYSLQIGPLAEADGGKTICLDSSFYPPSGVWKWAGPDVYPSWDGPHCFTIGPPAACDVTVTAPSGGETWTAGTNHSITWTTTDCATCDNVDISYSVDGGEFTTIAAGTTNDGEYTWMVPNTPSSNVVIKVCCAGSSDCGESGVFTIEAPAIPEIVSVDPNSAARCDEGLVVTITGANTDWQPSDGSNTTTVFLTQSGSPVIAASNVTVNSTTEVLATFSIPYNASTGLYDVIVDSWSAPADVLTDGFTINAAPAANIVLAPASLDFSADECAPDLGPKSFNVSSEGCHYDFTVSADVPWLNLPVLEGTTPTDIPVEVNEALMPGAGTYNATVTVTAAGAANSPQEVAITLFVPETPAPGGEVLAATLIAAASGGASDDLTGFGLDGNATDCYDAGIDEFEPPTPPGDYVRAFFNHPDWGEIQPEFNTDIRSPFSTLCKDFPLVVQTNLTEEITLRLSGVWNPGCYLISLLDESGATLVENFEQMDYSFTGNGGTTSFTIRVCAGGGGTGPTITCPETPIDAFICDAGQVCVPLPIVNATSVTVDGATWDADQLCFNADTAGTYSYDVTADNSCGSDNCTVVVNVGIGGAPVIDCPSTELAAERCGPGQICVPLAITGATTVTAVGATWDAGQLCFDVGSSDAYGFQVIASSDCGADTCDVLVNVTVNDVPVIDCPQSPISVMVAAGETCEPLAIAGATSVTVETTDWTASWADGQFCFDASVAGEYSAKIIATNSCGVDTCDVSVSVQECPPPVVDCPGEAINVELCSLAPITIPLAVSDADSVTVSAGTWSNGEFSFTPGGFGSFPFTLTAYNSCDIVTCDFTVIVTQLPMPVITCPDGAFDYTLCAAEEICVDLPIANADSVMVENGATWADGTLCFIGEPDMDYSFVVHAFNSCGEDVCTVVAHVHSFAAPLACFTADPTEGVVPLEVTFTGCSTIDPGLTATYMWDFDDGGSSTEENPVHTFGQIGCYDVTLTVTDDCGHQDAVTHTVCATDNQVVIPTDRWINIYCPEPMLDGTPLSPGDIITAYDPDGVLCGMGEVQADGSYGLIPIYADDIYTPDVDEGADVGDLISIKINGVAVSTDPLIFWTENGANFMVCTFTAEACVTFDLDAGWHLISWNVDYSGDIAAMLAEFSECVDVVLSFDQGGLTYDPSLPEFSTLTNVDFYHGYWFRLSCPVSFEVCGGIINPNDYIQVYSGWNLVSYWPNETLPVTDGFASLLADNNLLVAYGFDGAAMDYIPGDPMHQTLTELWPGYGYWVKVQWDAALSYPDFVAAPPRGDHHVSMVASNGIVPSRGWMSIYGADLEVDGEAVRSGATVDVYTDDGVRCGSGVYSGGVLKFTSVYGFEGDNEATAQYPKTGDHLNLRIDGVQVATDLTYQGDGSRVSLSSLSASALLPGSYSMSQNYPNPFNPTTNFSFSLPVAGHVELSVYNVLGQKVATVANGQFTAGTHEVTWNGADESGNAVGSGIYFYRITTGDFDQTKKMILMK